MIVVSLTGSSVGLRRCLTKGGGPRFEHPGGTLGNSPVYWGGLPGQFSGAPRGLWGWGCISRSTTPRLSKKKLIVVENVDVRSDRAINSKKLVNIIVVVTENKWRYK